MNQIKGTVEPIRDWQKIQEMKTLLIDEQKYRDWLMLVLGLNFALRISDLLRIRVSDVYDPDMYPRNRLILREKKTNKENFLAITNSSRDALIDYVKLSRIKFSDDYLYKSRQGGNRSIDRIQAYRILNQIAEKVGLSDINVGTHTLRKSWGYHAYKRFNLSLDDIMLKLNHQSIQSTKRYIGLTFDEKADIEGKVSF
jgi:integrase